MATWRSPWHSKSSTTLARYVLWILLASSPSSICRFLKFLNFLYFIYLFIFFCFFFFWKIKVEYDGNGWVVKNKDPENAFAERMFQSSQNPVVKKIWSDSFSGECACKYVCECVCVSFGIFLNTLFPMQKMLTEKAKALCALLPRRTRWNQGKARLSWTLQKHWHNLPTLQAQLKDLIDTLKRTNTNFVRCIIPNHKKTPGKFDSAGTLKTWDSNQQ